MPPRSLIAVGMILLATIASVAAAAPEPGYESAAPAQPQSTQPPVAPPQAAPLTTSTRQNSFTIPFRIEPAQTPDQQPVEVQLHCSANGGSTWEIAGRAKPEKGAFVFRAPRDGEYWYSIRTVDKQGAIRPEAPLQAQLKVTVDTVAPRLELSAVRGAAGEIVARWQAVDPHLKLASFKLEYQANSSDPWERVAVDSPPSAMQHTLSGEATWWPRTVGGAILVRAEIVDEAGNPAVSQAVVKAAAVAAPGEMARSLAPEPPLSNSRPGAATRWTADRSTSDPLPRSTLVNAPSGEPADRDANWRMAPSQDARGGNSQGFAPPSSQAARGGPFGSPLDFSRLPPGQRPRMVNSRTFELEYEIDSVGPSGVGKVELWGTRDGGRTWSIFGADPDNRSPLPVSLDGEGIFGFRVVVQSGSGLGGRPPAENDMPDIWVGVDLTKPTGRITGTTVAAESGELLIAWEAADDVLDARPIALSFSVGAGGPWTLIAAGLENTGRYRWRLDNRVPDNIYLRLEVRDEAGNVGTFETAEPVSLDRHRPEGRIRGVRAVAH